MIRMRWPPTPRRSLQRLAMQRLGVQRLGGRAGGVRSIAFDCVRLRVGRYNMNVGFWDGVRIRVAVFGAVAGIALVCPLTMARAAPESAAAAATEPARAAATTAAEPARVGGAEHVQGDAPAERTEPAAGAGSASAAARAADSDAPISPALDDLLNRASEDAPDAKRCIRQASIEDADVLNGNIIVFTDDRKRIFINQMRVKCSDLRPGAKVVYTSRGDGQLCQLDSIAVLLPGPGGLNTGPSCMLGRFEPITRDQLDVLKERYTPDGKDLIEAIFE